MDDSYLPSKRTLNPFFPPNNYGSSSTSSSSSSDKHSVKKQKLLSSFTPSTSPSKHSATASLPIESKSMIARKVEASTPTKTEKPKLYRIFQPQSSKPRQDATKCPPPPPPPSPPQQPDQMMEQTQQQSSPDTSSVTTVMITKSLSNIHVSDPGCIPKSRKASEWTTPSRSSPRPLAAITSSPMDIDDSNDDNQLLSHLNKNKKRHNQVPWPDQNTFMGGHIKQTSSGDPTISQAEGISSFQYRSKGSSCQLQQIMEAYGCTYLKSLGQKRLAKSAASPPTINHTASPTLLSKLRISSPSSSTTRSQYASFSDQPTPLPYDIEETMDALYPPGSDDSGWRYPACEDLLNRFKRGEWKITTSSSIVDNNMNWCDKYRPKQVEYLLDNQSHHRYIRDWLERQKVAPSKTDASFFAPRKKVTRREMEQHYGNLDEMNDNDDDDFMLPGESVGGSKKKKPTKKPRKDLNMIVLVGPHGAGKTAGVFTAAQETGYQVFEIHPGLRRSLKDVMRLVGDMTKNHLVRFHGIKSFLGQQQSNGNSGDSGLADGDNGNGGDDYNDNQNHGNDDNDADGHYNDMDTNKKPSTSKSNQLLTHFFAAKPATSSTSNKIKSKKQATLSATVPAPTNTDRDLIQNVIPINLGQSSITPKSPTLHSGPRQSLILLEEVDLLYQTDKGFWNAVTDLARNSKRPIILTCNDTSVIPFDILQLQAIVQYETPLRQLMLPFLHLICLMEGYLVTTAQLVALVDTIGLDIRQLLTTLEYLHYYQGTSSLLIDRQQTNPPKLHSSMLQAHLDLLMEQAHIYTLQKSWYHLSDNIPGAQLEPLCKQLAQNGSITNQSNIDVDSDDIIDDDNNDLLRLLQTWLDNRSLIDYGIGMTQGRISQVYGIDEFGGKDDHESGYLHSWKKHDDWDHHEMEAEMESSLLELNQPRQGSGLVDIMSWEVIRDQRNIQYEDDLLSVEYMVNCRSSMAMGSVSVLDITYSKHIEHLRQNISRKRRRRLRRLPI